MVPVRIVVQGFLSYRDRAEIMFDGAKLWALSGRNGVGKSALFDAITFALFGTGRFDSNAVQEYINHDRNDMTVEFDFDIGMRRYRVKRTGSRTKPSSFLACEISTDGSPIAGTAIDGKTPMQDWVHKMLGLGAQTFAACALLRQGESDRLLSARDVERAEMMKQIVDLSAYVRLHELVNEKAKVAEGTAKSLQLEKGRLTSEVRDQISGAIAYFNLDSITYPSNETWFASGERLVTTLRDIADMASEEVKLLQTRLLALASAKTILEGWKTRALDRLCCYWDRAAFNTVLEDADRIEWRITRFDEINRILPLCREWCDARNDWQEAEGEHDTAKKTLAAKAPHKINLEEQKIKASDALVEAQEKSDAATRVLIDAQNDINRLHERLRALENIEGKPICTVCGQELSLNRIPTEITNVTKQIAASSDSVAKAQKHLDATKQGVITIQNEIKRLDKNIQHTEHEIHAAEKMRERAAALGRITKKNAERILHDLHQTEDAIAQRSGNEQSYIPESIAERILGTSDNSLLDTLREGLFPDVGDIDRWEQEHQELIGAARDKMQLDKARDQAGKLDAQLNTLENQLAADHAALGTAFSSVGNTDDPAALIDALGIVENALKQEERNFSELAHETDPVRREAVRKAIYNRGQKMTGEIIEEVERRNEMCQENSAQAAATSKKAEADTAKLDETLKKHVDISGAQEQAARHASQLRTLEEKLSRRGLQSYLRVNAEQAIVANADTILQRLSDGMLHLDLRSGDDGKTLDLLVTDHEKSQRPMSPAALSGSQKFRVSVSLALGIGQYACASQQGGIKSVIIDEGFGSLDRENRELMVEELHNLGRVLERIVIVSHQEELEQAFPNRWRIFIDGSTAKAELAI